MQFTKVSNSFPVISRLALFGTTALSSLFLFSPFSEADDILTCGSVEYVTLWPPVCNTTLDNTSIVSVAPDGPHGGNASTFDRSSRGGAGIPGLELQLTNQGNTSLYVLNQGGDGGQGGDGDAIHDGSAGGRGGDGGVIELTSDSGTSILVTKDHAIGIEVLSQGGNGGGGGSGHVFSEGAGGANGGNGGDVTVTNDGSVSTKGAYGYGILARSIGGTAGDGGEGGWFGGAGSGGVGGNAGADVTVNNKSGSITTSGVGATAAMLHSVGGNGGDGGSSGLAFFSLGGSGGNGGNSEDVVFSNGGLIGTSGDGAHGVSALSVGGGGGHGGAAQDIGLFVGVAVGGSGGGGGNSGTVATTNSGSIETTGNHSKGILSMSIGGGGGDGGGASGAAFGVGASFQTSVGGSGGQGGSGSSVSFTQSGSGKIATGTNSSGNFSTGVLAMSVGGGGGLGGRAFAAGVSGDAEGPSLTLNVSLGGSGGQGGFGGDVTGQVGGSIVTNGRIANAFSAFSIGGGGGAGGNSTALGASASEVAITANVAVGGSGGAGGSGGSVTASVNGALYTFGDRSDGAALHSIGGGGGAGGSVTSVNAAAGMDSVNANVDIGGKGGIGHKGGNIVYRSASTSAILTHGTQAHGVSALSVGGGGGTGGSVHAYDGAVAAGDDDSVAVNLGVNLGGDGGIGAFGGKVSATHDGGIWTSGHQGHGALIQSIGGGGGAGGNVTSLGLALGSNSFEATANLGGRGYNGGIGGETSFTIGKGGRIATSGAQAYGAAVSSIGGGGGAGGAVNSFSAAGAISDEGGAANLGVNIGRDGGNGNAGGSVTFSHGGAIATSGHQSVGALLQSIGGGGGAGGNVTSVGGAAGKNSVNISADLGGDGGVGGNGSAVTFALDTGSYIGTAGDQAHGLVAQSIGGGGGNGGSVHNYAGSLVSGEGLGVSGGVFLGGSGGSGNVGGQVNGSQSGAIVTVGQKSYGALVQSIGGGGGNGGNVYSLNAVAALSKSEEGSKVAASIGIGGDGGAGNDGGSVSFKMLEGATINTVGGRSVGAKLQSIGGGGGDGGRAHTFETAVAGGSSSGESENSEEKEPTLVNVSVAIGGSGGGGGDGGQVDFAMAGSAAIATTGDQAHGAFVQSVGGGGGSGGDVTASGFQQEGSRAYSLALGGGGGAAGSGGNVTITKETGNAAIYTTGDRSYGVFAQSVGGGGGEGGESDAGYKEAPKLPDPQKKYKATTKILAISVGGSGGASGDGGNLTIETPANIVTTGQNAIGLFAQSVGGGGGDGAGADVDGKNSFKIGGSGGAGGNGGVVSVTSATSITTIGDNSVGIFAQSVGGGGGAAGGAEKSEADTTGTVDNLSLSIGGLGQSAGDGGSGGTVTVVPGGAITTQGQVSHGIFVQSVGGGGGLMQSAHTTVSQEHITFDLATNGNRGLGGSVVVDDTKSSTPLVIKTSGDGAIGVVAQSIGGGGGAWLLNKALADATMSISSGDYSGSDFNSSIGVNVSLGGTISTSGNAAHGILAQAMTNATTVFASDGFKTVGNASASQSNNEVAIYLRPGSSVSTSGSAAHAVRAQSDSIDVTLGGDLAVSGANSWAVYADSPLQTSATSRYGLQVQDGASITATGGAAGGIFIDQTTTSNIDVEINGSINASGRTALSSNGQGNYRIGKTGVVFGDIHLSYDGTTGEMPRFENSGDLTGSFTGEFYHLRGGRHFLNLDPTGASSSKISAGGFFSADSGGRTIPQLTALPGRAFVTQTIIENGRDDGQTSAIVAGDPLPFGLAQGTAATTFTYQSRTESTSDGSTYLVDVTGATVDFGGAGLTGNAGAIAEYVDGQLSLLSAAGGQAAAQELYAVTLQAANALDTTALAKDLEVLDASNHHYTAQATSVSTTAHLNNMQSCGSATGAFAMIQQHDCTWSKVSFDTTRFDWNNRVTSAMFSLGAQQEVVPNVVVGVSGAYEQSYSQGETTSGDGHRIHAGGIVKYSNGPIYSSVSLAGSYGWGDNKRLVSIPGSSMIASSDQETYAVATRLRAGYLFEYDTINILPLVELDLALIQDEGYQEQGAGSLNLKVDPKTHFFADLHPAVRIGSDAFDLGDGVLARGYVEAGARIALNDSSVTVSLPNSFLPQAGIDQDFEREDVMATLATGASLFWGDKLEAQLRYEAGIGSETLSHSASLKIGMKF
jgi:hypothetical protein